MIEYGEILIDSLTGYSNPAMRVSRITKNGEILRLKNGVYETEKLRSKFQPAQVIYGPSYISFGTALSFYGIVPEYAYHVTNATYSKHKDKVFHTKKYSYYYTDVPKKAFPFEVNTIQLGDYVYRIATREKAVCDKLYKMPPMRDVDELYNLMFYDLRFDDEYISELSYKTVTDLSELYGCKNVRLFSEYLGGIA